MYSQLQNTYVNKYKIQSRNIKEKFLTRSALRGSIVKPADGNPDEIGRSGLASIYPMKNSPVELPSPLSTRYEFALPDVPIEGIL